MIQTYVEDDASPRANQRPTFSHAPVHPRVRLFLTDLNWRKFRNLHENQLPHIASISRPSFLWQMSPHRDRTVSGHSRPLRLRSSHYLIANLNAARVHPWYHPVPLAPMRNHDTNSLWGLLNCIVWMSQRLVSRRRKLLQAQHPLSSAVNLSRVEVVARVCKTYSG